METTNAASLLFGKLAASLSSNWRPIISVVLLLTSFSSAVKAQSCGAAKSPTSQSSCSAPSQARCGNRSCESGSASSSRKTLTPKQKKCGLYMAPSSIANSGWGVYAGRDYSKYEKILPLDLGISIVDHQYQQSLQETPVPDWVLEQYHWASVVIQGLFDADQSVALLPGIGMLANSHTGLANLDLDGPNTRERLPRSHPAAGAVTHYQQMAFSSRRELAAGEELFVEYGEEWFQRRAKKLSDLPLADDFDIADEIVNKWEALMLDIHSELAKDVWEMLILGMAPIMRSRVRRALPKTYNEALRTASLEQGTAEATLLPKSSKQSMEWLEQNAYCLDNIDTRESKVVDKQHGAFARRFIAKNALVAPVPLTHLSRQHLEIRTVDVNDDVTWKGSQLLLNYCYGHKDSSILLFPYSPGINLINNANASMNATANVALKWSTSSDLSNQLLTFDTSKLLHFNSRAGLMMELYALRDIAADEELFMDYGTDWNIAWQKHLINWPIYADTMVNFNDYQSSWDFETDEEIYTVDETDRYPPSYIQVRVYMDLDDMQQADDGWYVWQNTDYEYLNRALPCLVQSADYQIGEDEKTYHIICQKVDGSEIKVKNVPWSAITFTENAYVGHQFLRQAFRHEIRLPDHLFPDKWKDLAIAEEPDDFCGLYLAESSIPNSGLGMFTTKPIKRDERVFYGEVVIQLEDYEVNVKLGRWYKNDFDTKDDVWLLDNYYWEPAVSLGQFEAASVYSVIPGLGMLANSHPGLVNCDIQMPMQLHDLNRSTDPGTGASTTYHDFHYKAIQDIIPGEEIFVRYGDTWFEPRAELGPIPLSTHFYDADYLLSRFVQITSRNLTLEFTNSFWNLLHSNLARFEAARLATALSFKVEDIPVAHSHGTAKFSTPNRIRPQEWLQEHGLCLDNIKPGRSTLKQAGQGAFATRRIKKGKVILPMPLVHILRHDLGVYGSNDWDDPDEPVRYLGQQLLLNYCYGHKNSSMLLFPYSPVSNYLNHNVTQCNAKLQWSSLPNHQSSWFNRTPAELRLERHAGLILEVVALRDIELGEEIFLNYGSEWESSWQQYLQDWSPPADSGDFVPASILNERMEWLRTIEELKNDPYPSSTIGTLCFIGSSRVPVENDNDDTPKFMWQNDESKDRPNVCEVLAREDDTDVEEAYARKDSIRPVDIRYEVMVYFHNKQERNSIFVGIPRTAIRFYDIQYQSDLFIRSAFRHEIHIPDTMIPEAWRDLKSSI